MNIFKVIGWTHYDDPNYPVSDYSVAIDYAVIAELKEKGYKFGGDAHQEMEGCCPIINNGAKACYAKRAWGGLMAEAQGINNDPYAYMEWYMDGWTREGMIGEDGIERQSVYPVECIDKSLISENLRGKTIHTMRLAEKPYKSLESGEKTVEVRLNDEKRKRVKVGDIIVFFTPTEEIKIIVTEVVKLHCFDNFTQLFQSPLFKYTGSKNMSAEQAVNSMYEYYSKEDEQQNGVLGIELKVLV